MNESKSKNGGGVWDCCDFCEVKVYALPWNYVLAEATLFNTDTGEPISEEEMQEVMQEMRMPTGSQGFCLCKQCRLQFDESQK